MASRSGVISYIFYNLGCATTLRRSPSACYGLKSYYFCYYFHQEPSIYGPSGLGTGTKLKIFTKVSNFHSERSEVCKLSSTRRAFFYAPSQYLQSKLTIFALWSLQIGHIFHFYFFTFGFLLISSSCVLVVWYFH